jgi:hypothetical protein
LAIRKHESKKQNQAYFHILGYMLQQSRIESGHLEKNKLPFKGILAIKNLKKKTNILSNLRKRSSFGEIKKP